MSNDKSGNDDLTKESFETFWSEVKKPFLSYILHSFGKEELYTTLQRQAIIKFITNKDKDKRLIQNQGSISPLNVDVIIISKALSKRLKNVFPSLISDNQSASVDGRFIAEDGRLIADVLKITDVLKLNGMLVTVVIQKAFDSVDLQFLTLALKIGQNLQ